MGMEENGNSNSRTPLLLSILYMFSNQPLRLKPVASTLSRWPFTLYLSVICYSGTDVTIAGYIYTVADFETDA